jgi:hypothetical protein
MNDLPESPDWDRLRSILGGAEFVPGAVRRMVRATSMEEASAAYWELDNRVVVQGQLFEAALWTARSVAFAVCRGEASACGLTRALDLLVEIAAGEPDQSEVKLGNAGLGDMCRRELRQYLPCFRELAVSGDDQTLLGVLDLLDILEVDRQRLREVAETILTDSPSLDVESRARDLMRGD